MSDRMVWVGCMSCYNGGILLGRWVEAADAASLTVGELHTGELQTKYCDEMWCYDVDGWSAGVGEMSVTEATELDATMTEIEDVIGEENWDAYAAWHENTIGNDHKWDVSEIDDFYEAYQGRFDMTSDFAYDLAQSTGAITDDTDGVWPFSLIDWDEAWGELRTGGDFYDIYDPESGGYWIFRTV